MERLDKIISSRTGLSRKEAKAAISGGKVSVNGKIVRSSELKVGENDEIFLGCNKISEKAHLYIVLNKPQGYVSATEDPKQKTVLELVPEDLSRSGLFPAGRLDKDTTGLMIITDDGDFAHRILSPKKHVPKKYAVEIDLPVTAAMEKGFAEGIELSDGICKTAKLEITGEYSCEVTLSEGRYHQIKRMFGCFGAKVTKLHRLSMGGFSLPEDLAEGKCREITEEELALIESKV
ncbi:MAG: 16S rRNA pseudouridine(516) synthase [Oscillospiraceae bacterium]|nr:16S rRNA pseudouridine(516) synthase [Oscillospiraceae bacterium]